MLKEEILRKISQEDIFQRYFPEQIALDKHYCNPWREDDTPDCYFVKYGQKLLFVDFAFSPTHIDCFLAAGMTLQLKSFKDILNQVSKDFGLGLHRPESLDDVAENKTPIETKKLVLEDIPKVETIIKVVNQPFKIKDLEYWAQFGISEKTLVKYNVKSCYRAWINDTYYHEYKENDPMYCYRELDKFKLYRPEASKVYKWRSNMAGGILEGWNQLPDKGDFLFITKSLKDVMTLHDLGYPAVACKSETVPVSDNAMKLLKDRFPNIIVWFDNDEAGVEGSKKLTSKYNLPYFNIPKGMPKDPSDFIRELGKEPLISLINEHVINRLVREDEKS